jgi:hypothetical protein
MVLQMVVDKIRADGLDNLNRKQSIGYNIKLFVLYEERIYLLLIKAMSEE